MVTFKDLKAQNSDIPSTAQQTAVQKTTVR